MQRREYLAGLAVTILSGASGCLSSRSASAQLGKINLLNQDNRPHTLHIQVKRNGEPVYRSTHQLRRSSQTGTSEYPVTVVTGKWPSESGKFVVTGQVDGQTGNNQITLTKSQCYGLILEISKRGKISIFTGTYDGEGICSTSN